MVSDESFRSGGLINILFHIHFFSLDLRVFIRDVHHVVRVGVVAHGEWVSMPQGREKRTRIADGVLLVYSSAKLQSCFLFACLLFHHFSFPPVNYWGPYLSIIIAPAS